MELTGTEVRYGMTATANPSSVHVSGSVTIGTPSETLTYEDPPAAAYSIVMVIYGGDTLTMNLSDGDVTGTVAGQNQVETATAAGTVVTSGIAQASITSAITATSPIIVTFNVVSGDTPTVWAGKLRTALLADPRITAFYTPGGSSTAISLTSNEKLPNDSSLNISIVNQTSSGITPVTTSTNTTAGVGNSRAYRIDGKVWDKTDFQGNPLPTMNNVCSSLLKSSSSGTANVLISGGGKSDALPPGGIDLCAVPAGQHAWDGESVTFEADGTGVVNLQIDIQAR